MSTARSNKSNRSKAKKITETKTVLIYEHNPKGKGTVLARKIEVLVSVNVDLEYINAIHPKGHSHYRIV